MTKISNQTINTYIDFIGDKECFLNIDGKELKSMCEEIKEMRAKQGDDKEN